TLLLGLRLPVGGPGGTKGGVADFATALLAGTPPERIEVQTHSICSNDRGRGRCVMIFKSLSFIRHAGKTPGPDTPEHTRRKSE
ncbi:MAG: hypothetical protein ACI9OJ_003272, partial [Myxococcota bacterium]